MRILKIGSANAPGPGRTRTRRTARLRGILKGAAKTLVATLALLLVVEAAIRIVYHVRKSRVEYVALPYLITHNYGPVPPWADGARIMDWDEHLNWKLRPGVRRKYMDVFSPVRAEEDRTALLRQFSPSVPDALRKNPVWEVSINAEGFRDDEFTTRKAPGTFRVICLGDSWTFGANVGQEQSYPQQLEAILRREFPGARAEVLNLGVLGYSSYQGLELLKRKALDYEPDLLVIGFAMNDGSVPGYRDKDMPAVRKNPRLRKRVINFLNKFETSKLLLYFGLVLRYKSTSIGEHLWRMAERGGEPEALWWGGGEGAAVDYEKNELYTRVSPADYGQNIREMVSLARGRGAGSILLYNHLRPTPYLGVLEKISAEEGVPLVDGQALVAAARRRLEEELEASLGLAPDAPRAVAHAGAGAETEVVFRVYSGAHEVPDAIYIAGAHTKLGDAVPNRVRMYDDGTHGDQRAGDRVWSYAAGFAPGTKLFYVYTNSGTQGRWENLDVPEVRSLTVPGGAGRVYPPVETFGVIYMQADGWHTDARGYGLIARGIAEALERDERLRARPGA